MLQDQIINATLKDVSLFVQNLEATFLNLPTELRTVIVLSVQELCVNVVEHAYAGITGVIRFHLEWKQGELQMRFVDDAPNVYTASKVISAPDPLDLPEGGMGMFIIYQTFDRVEYERLPAGNSWTLFKEIAS